MGELEYTVPGGSNVLGASAERAEAQVKVGMG